VRTIPAGEFKAKCLKIMDEVSETCEPVVVTKRGKPVVRLVASIPAEPPESIFGALREMATIVGDPEDLVNPIVPAEDWDLELEPHMTVPQR
jgi:prevent-host-death family protein